MCARFTLKSSSDVVGGLFDLEDLPDLRPRFNIAPTQDILAVISLGGERTAAWFRWGLIPSWAKDLNIGQKMINARSETASEKPSFRNAFRKHRCLIVADGFYEWTDPDPRDFEKASQIEAPTQNEGAQRTLLEEPLTLFGDERFSRGEAESSSGVHAKPKGTAKLPRQPWWIGMKSHAPFAFAGLWELNQQTELGSVETCCILTTTPNKLLEPMHDRMPVILPKDHWDLWLDPEFSNVDALEALMIPYSAAEMETYKVDPELNNPRREGKDYSLEWPHAS